MSQRGPCIDDVAGSVQRQLRELACAGDAAAAKDALERIGVAYVDALEQVQQRAALQAALKEL